MNSLYYTDIPQRKSAHGLSGANLTNANLDKSQILVELLAKEYQNSDALLFGEL